jgi:hypothetical protein
MVSENLDKSFSNGVANARDIAGNPKPRVYFQLFHLNAAQKPVFHSIPDRKLGEKAQMASTTENFDDGISRSRFDRNGQVDNSRIS